MCEGGHGVGRKSRSADIRLSPISRAYDPCLRHGLALLSGDCGTLSPARRGLRPQTPAVVLYSIFDPTILTQFFSLIRTVSLAPQLPHLRHTYDTHTTGNTHTTYTPLATHMPATHTATDIHTAGITHTAAGITHAATDTHRRCHMHTAPRHHLRSHR
jgi:hypothetical protein